jgi:hypothetical protein
MGIDLGVSALVKILAVSVAAALSLFVMGAAWQTREPLLGRGGKNLDRFRRPPFIRMFFRYSRISARVATAPENPRPCRS